MASFRSIRGPASFLLFPPGVFFSHPKKENILVYSIWEGEKTVKNKAAHPVRDRRLCPIRLACGMVSLFSGAEQKGYAPYPRQCHQSVNDTGNDGTLTTANPCHYIKRKQTDTPPVQSTDNGKEKSNSVENHVKTILPSSWVNECDSSYTVCLFYQGTIPFGKMAKKDKISVLIQAPICI